MEAVGNLMRAVLVELSEQECKPSGEGTMKAVLKIAHSPGHLTQRERERERERVLAEEVSLRTATYNAMVNGTLNSIFRLCVARIRKYC